MTNDHLMTLRVHYYLGIELFPSCFNITPPAPWLRPGFCFPSIHEMNREAGNNTDGEVLDF